MSYQDDIERLRTLRLGEDVVRIALSAFLYRNFATVHKARWLPEDESRRFLLGALQEYAGTHPTACLDNDETRRGVAVFLTDKMQARGITFVSKTALRNVLGRYAEAVRNYLDLAVRLMS